MAEDFLKLLKLASLHAEGYHRVKRELKMHLMLTHEHD